MDKKFWILGGLAAAIAVIIFWKKASASTALWKVGDILIIQIAPGTPSFEVTIADVRFVAAPPHWEYRLQLPGQLPQTWWNTESLLVYEVSLVGT